MSLNVAALLIDMQPAFLSYSEDRKIIPNQLLVLKECAKREIPIFIIEYHGELATVECILKKVRKAPEFYILRKSSDSAFRSTSLHDLLRNLRIDTLLLMGVSASACVYDTARDAIERGYKLITSNTVIANYTRPGVTINEIEGWYIKNTSYSKNELPLLNKKVHAKNIPIE